jgi:hypothetical protein
MSCSDNQDENLRELERVREAAARPSVFSRVYADLARPLPKAEGKKFDAGKPRTTLVPASVINAILRIDRERVAEWGSVASPRGMTRDNLNDVCDNLVDGEYDQALYDCLALLTDTCLAPLAGLDQIVEVLEVGAIKYDVNNWQKLTDAKNRYENAAWRHLLALCRGELTDPESGKPHAAHLGCNLVFLTWFRQEGKI